ncbi:hypothetical protein [Vibrio mediterranei]|uniref:hypothetical protein n=1 Tax=Vibrio mediterranei TaxID=689 RepID=UPI002283FA19|nr:hypothetical protein [Vibrio mediterranei]MCY9855453.1 hypothetical protein [Vibrio mediterranei]
MLYRYIEYLEEQGGSLRKDECPAIADKNKIYHLEIDVILGQNNKYQTISIIKKAYKVVTIRSLKSKSAEVVIEGFKDVRQSIFYDFKTITADNGTEFVSHEESVKITNADFYFVKPYTRVERTHEWVNSSFLAKRH